MVISRTYPKNLKKARSLYKDAFELGQLDEDKIKVLIERGILPRQVV